MRKSLQTEHDKLMPDEDWLRSRRGGCGQTKGMDANEKDGYYNG